MYPPQFQIKDSNRLSSAATGLPIAPSPHTRDTSCCLQCLGDREFLRRLSRPNYYLGVRRLKVVDLFCGCGALSLGFSEGLRRRGMATQVVLAVDNDETAAKAFEGNLFPAHLEIACLEHVFDGSFLGPRTRSESDAISKTGEIDALLAGPPCQGHSDLNNHTRRSDPRNLLYLRAIRAVEVLAPKVAILENVPSIRHDRSGVLEAATNQLERLGYAVDSGVYDLTKAGVPQRRKRHLLVAVSRNDLTLKAFDPRACLDHCPRSVSWAIDDLIDASGVNELDWSGAPSDVNRRRIDWLFDHSEDDLPNSLRPKCHQSDHSYKSMYGRLRWDEPAQTITSGYGSMGQGRFVHPLRRRTLTPHEAARLQGIPDFFSFGEGAGRGKLATMIGNAVPPLLGVRLGEWVADLIQLQ